MLQQRGFLVIIALSCILQAQGADKYTDENRPYEFGFKIDGEQHRHEKKDENGLIMGEFGFITADGVYHVTVYATDENGNFKILSMKNIRVKPYPTAPARESHALPFPPSKNPPQTQGLPSQKPLAAVAGPSPASPAKSCSHCSIPTSTTPRPQLTDLAQVSKDQRQFLAPGTANSQYPQGQGQNYPQSGLEENYPQQDNTQNSPQGGIADQNNPQPGQSGPTYPQGSGFYTPQVAGGFINPARGSEQNYPQSGPDYSHHGENSPPNTGGPQNSGTGNLNTPGQTLQTPFVNSNNDRNPKQFTDYPQQPNIGQPGVAGQFGPAGSQPPSKPTLITAQMQIVDKNTDIYQKKPGEKDGLPDGLTKDDMVRLLYTFNYTVGFHGHFEEGYTNGAKQGYYYVTGRNGIRTRVDYVADEKGFRPKITQEVLDLLSDDVPKLDTEKDEKYGLKGYEFKWLYYPVDSRRR